MYAIIKTSGSQYKVEVGTAFEIDRVAAEAGEEIVLNDNVLMLSNEGQITLGDLPSRRGRTSSRRHRF